MLASDEFLGRGPATAGEEKTVAYIAEQSRAAGLQPGGPNGSWYQEVPLNESDIVGRPELAFNVGGRRQSLTQGEQIAVRATMQNIDRVAIDRAPVVFLGYGVKAPERNWDDFKGMRSRTGGSALSPSRLSLTSEQSGRGIDHRSLTGCDGATWAGQT